MDALTDRPLIHGDGTPEAVWRGWELASGVAELAPATWTTAGTRLLVVAPHPDDELLACGGLLCDHIAGGGQALIIAVTDGEASHPGSTTWSPERLAPARRAERAEGMARLGLAEVPTLTLGLRDGQVTQQVDHLTSLLLQTARPGDIVVSTWRGDGHPDHDATGRAAAAAAQTRGCRHIEAPVWMWHWATPADPRVPWVRLRRLPVAAAIRARKCRALAAHATQLADRDNGEGPVLGEQIRARAERLTEYFFV